MKKIKNRICAVALSMAMILKAGNVPGMTVSAQSAGENEVMEETSPTEENVLAEESATENTEESVTEEESMTEETAAVEESQQEENTVTEESVMEEQTSVSSLETALEAEDTTTVVEDTTAPVVTGFSMSVEPGTYVGENDVVTFTVTAEDDVALNEEKAYILLRSPLMNKIENYDYKVNLTYQGDGTYIGSVTASDLYACEWYVMYGYIYDSAGNYAFIPNSSYDYPYYFYVQKDGTCEQAVREQLTINFYNADRELICSFEKENVPLRTTLGEILGEDYPVLETDETLGEFKGWATYYDTFTGLKDFYDSDTPLLLGYGWYGYSTLNLYASYENRYIYVYCAYMAQDGVWEMDQNTILCKVGTTYEEVLEALPIPKDVKSKYYFQGWKDEGFVNASKVGNYVLQEFSAVAAYDQYPIDITKTYIDNNGEVRTVTETRDYPAGTRYEDILAEVQTTPEDASAEYPITGWKIFDTKKIVGAITTEGEIGAIWDLGEVWANYFNLVAEYDTQTLVGVEYDYVNQDALPFAHYYLNLTKFVLCNNEEKDSQDAIYEKALACAPEDHMEELEFTGNWTISSESCGTTEYYAMTADYNKVKVIFAFDAGGQRYKYKVAAGEPGEIISLPEGYDYGAYYDSDGKWHSSGTEYPIPEDAGDSVTVYCHKIDNSDDLIQQIEEAEDGAIVETIMSGTAELSTEVLEALQGKDVTLSVVLDDEITWNINGTHLPEVELTDIDLSVIRSDKEAGNISADTITSLAADRTAEQLIFGQEGVFDFNTQLTLGMADSNSAEKGVLLQKVDGVLQLADSALVADNAVTFKVSQGADSAVIYGTNGDTNGDDEVTIKDLMQVLYHVSSRTTMNEVQKGFADVDMNNSVNIQDLMRELYYVSGRNTSL